MRAKYVNPFTDFGFKKIFGEEASKPQLIDFLNALLPPINKIKDLSFKNTEQLGQTEADRKAVYDIYCEAENGQKFIVELQKAKQNYFRERTIYYSTFPIREQAEKGNWNYNLSAVFCIGILDFTFDDYLASEYKDEVLHTIKLKNQHGRVFYDKLTYIYLEMPNFHKSESELETRLDKWLYFIKNLEDFQQIPTIFKENVFVEAFEKAAIANFRQAELDSYEASLKIFRDNKAVFDYAKETAYNEGREEGMAKGREEGIAKGIEQGIEQGRKDALIEMAKAMKLKGLPVQTIAELTGLSAQEINQI